MRQEIVLSRQKGNTVHLENRKLLIEVVVRTEVRIKRNIKGLTQKGLKCSGTHRIEGVMGKT